MVDRESNVESSASSDGFVRQLLLEWIQSTAQKQKQLAACLALFELLQRRRCELIGLSSGSELSCLLGDRVGDFLDALRGIVQRGTVRVAGSPRVKPSKLALVASETVALVCGDIAAQFMTSDGSAKDRLIANGLMIEVLEATRFFLKTQLQWHSHSSRRQFLVYALQHLQAYVEACDTVVQDLNEDHDSNAVAAIGVLCWHWEAAASLLCTRSDVSSRIQQNQPTEIFVRVLKKWSDHKLYSKHSSASPAVVYAQLHYVCVLMDSMGGVKGCAKALESLSAEAKAYVVFNMVGGLSTAARNGDDAAVLFVVKVLRAVLSTSSGLNLLSTQDEEQEVLSELLRLHGTAHLPSGTSGTGSRGDTELEFFVADLIISRSLLITELVRRAGDSHTPVRGRTKYCLSSSN